jgi:hypothetical protein
MAESFVSATLGSGGTSGEGKLGTSGVHAKMVQDDANKIAIFERFMANFLPHI